MIEQQPLIKGSLAPVGTPTTRLAALVLTLTCLVAACSESPSDTGVRSSAAEVAAEKEGPTPNCRPEAGWLPAAVVTPDDCRVVKDQWVGVVGSHWFDIASEAGSVELLEGYRDALEAAGYEADCCGPESSMVRFKGQGLEMGQITLLDNDVSGVRMIRYAASPRPE